MVPGERAGKIPVQAEERPIQRNRRPVFVGTAGWTVRKDPPEVFRGEGSHLERYARGLNCVEINSTFYREHRSRTWVKWAATVPEEFRFAVKAPRTITHEGKLRRTGAGVQRFVEQVSGLGEKLGPLLFQLPPKLAFDEGMAEDFLEVVREVRPVGAVVLEPRHASWFSGQVSALLRRYGVARVAADPARVPEAARAGGEMGLRYWRLHGSPRTYYSGYTQQYLVALAAEIAEAKETAEVWCIFDNTALGEALGNARTVFEAMRESNPPGSLVPGKAHSG